MSLGNFREAVECCDKALQIDPAHVASLSNKGAALGYLGLHGEAIKCFEKILEIDPENPGGHINLGIAYLNTNVYEEAVKSFQYAKKIFERTHQTDAAFEAHKFELLSINASKLLSNIKPIDDEFLICLSSQSLIDLRDSSQRISKELDVVIEDFSKKELPVEVQDLLFSKQVVYKTLSDALNFEYGDLSELEKAKKIFEKWDLKSLIIEINSIDTFVRKLKEHEDLESISHEDEIRLLFVLKTIHILEEKLTAEIPDKFTAKFNRPELPIKKSEDNVRIEIVQVVEGLS